MAVVADALVSKLVEMLISTIASEIDQEVRLVVGVKKQVKILTNNLQSIQAVLIDAERRQVTEKPVQLWLERLKEVSYDIDDVLDGWIFAIMKSQIEENHRRKVWSFILSPYFSLRGIRIRRNIAVKITDLNERLDVIATQKDKYGFSSSLKGNNEQVDRLLTTPFVDTSEVKGREVDKEKLVNMLFGESSETPKLHLISIVGMGGIGKTTLAKLVYNDERVMAHFGKKIWVCVSDPFDEMRIAKEILESLQREATNLVALPNIMEKIQELVKEKRVLVVLDDVWSEDPKKWKQLEDCLKSCLSGSRILVTTRNEKVGRIMGCLESNIFRIGLLSEEECWELFCMIAFSGRSNQEKVNLEKTGREIVGRCKGLPLALRTMAGLLQFKRSSLEWESVLDSELWEVEEVERDVLAPLWLSYYDLPSPLKQCFLYCAMFPKDYEMEKGELIELWMAQGYIKATKTKDMEMVGEEYFQNLVMRSLFQDIEEIDFSYTGLITYCKMHDMVHDFASSLARKECLSIEVNGAEETISKEASFSGLHHLSIEFGESDQLPDSFYNLRKLRSLYALRGSSISVDTLRKCLSVMTYLRTLNLCNCGIVEIPSNISELVHLRRLVLSHNPLKELPETVCELYNLQTLNVEWCTSLKKFPKGIAKLTNLRHLFVAGAYLLSLPKEIERLSGLRRLDAVRIDAVNEEVFSLKNLKNLNQLSGSLIIDWSKVCDGEIEDAKKAHLIEKKHITELDLQFAYSQTEHAGELAEALKPSLNLEYLRVDCYMGTKSPSWLISLTALKKLKLFDWGRCEHLPPLGNLPSLVDLTLGYFERVKRVGVEFMGMDEMLISSSSVLPIIIFPKLTTLKFGFMGEWEEWNDAMCGDEQMIIMPCLTSLEIDTSPKLKALPNFIREKTHLKLRISDCDALDYLPSYFKY